MQWCARPSPPGTVGADALPGGWAVASAELVRPDPQQVAGPGSGVGAGPVGSPGDAVATHPSDGHRPSNAGAANSLPDEVLLVDFRLRESIF